MDGACTTMKKLNSIIQDFKGGITHKTTAIIAGFVSNLRTFKIDQNALTFLIFLGLSMFFWFLQALNKEYETELKFPVQYNNPPKGFILENELPEKILLQVTDEGFSILRYKLTNTFIPISLNIGNIMQRSQLHDGKGHSILLSRELKDGISRQLSSGTKLQSIFPDTIHFRYSKLLSKKVPVVSHLDILPAKQHIISGNIQLKPDSVTIYGPGSMIDTIKQMYTESEIFHDIQDTLIRNIGLNTYKQVEMDKSRVVVTIPVESFTEKILSIPVTGQSFPDSLQLRTFPGLVDVSFIVALSHYNDIHPEDIKVFIDYEDVKSKAKGTAKVNLQINQAWIQNVRLKQNELEYLVEYSKSEI